MSWRGLCGSVGITRRSHEGVWTDFSNSVTLTRHSVPLNFCSQAFCQPLKILPRRRVIGPGLTLRVMGKPGSRLIYFGRRCSWVPTFRINRLNYCGRLSSQPQKSSNTVETAMMKFGSFCRLAGEEHGQPAPIVVLPNTAVVGGREKAPEYHDGWEVYEGLQEPGRFSYQTLVVVGQSTHSLSSSNHEVPRHSPPDSRFGRRTKRPGHNNREQKKNT